MAVLPIIVLGAGGHAKVVIDALLASGAQILGVTDLDPKTHGESILGIPVLGGDDTLSDHPANTVVLTNGIGSISRVKIRWKIFEHFKAKGYAFAKVVHPSAIIAPDVTLGEGAQVMAGAVIQPGTQIGPNTIVNSRASIDHDCIIGDHTHIAPGTTLSGAITVGEAVHVGAGTTVIQGIQIGAECVIAAGSVVLENVSGGAMVAGAPAKVKS